MRCAREHILQLFGTRLPGRGQIAQCPHKFRCERLRILPGVRNTEWFMQEFVNLGSFARRHPADDTVAKQNPSAPKEQSKGHTNNTRPNRRRPPSAIDPHQNSLTASLSTINSSSVPRSNEAFHSVCATDTPKSFEDPVPPPPVNAPTEKDRTSAQ